ncbi:hypothetical protein PIB30_037522 [Stylosanthes scabra]|uniref:Uncharacterized protein n=1 Tax=Stylosanthes scabra TaxID=79078 RepID=A0ABU6QDH7_9FABA|nr:hypothetical protein [Stylosanthes scabra]
MEANSPSSFFFLSLCRPRPLTHAIIAAHPRHPHCCIFFFTDNNGLKLAFCFVVDSGIFVITCQEARSDVDPTIVLSYVISGFSALLYALCYTEFAGNVPVASSSFSFLSIMATSLNE